MSTTELDWFKSSYSGSEGDNCVEVAWLKSSYSGGGGDNCIEVGWLKSTHSGGGGGNCVEVSMRPEAVLVRDSKDTRKPPLTVSPAAWAAFTAHATSSRV